MTHGWVGDDADAPTPDSNEAPQTPADSKVTLMVMGAPDQQVSYVDGMTAGDALRTAGVELRKGQTLTLAGERIGHPDRVKLQPGVTLVVSSQVANG